ncbi:MAG: PQQ-binding-like beta-propeller repeat protein [Leadbetterella sp.]|nr:PQQ-binding-like beta-propeller repeat protein [Leadbetterella sp.]
MKKIAVLLVIIICFGFIKFQIIDHSFGSDENWSEYLGGADRNHYSKLDQINLQNVKNLKVAWEYATPDSGQMQVNPLIVDGVLFGVTSSVQAFALDATTGKEIWRFGDPLKNWASTSRGVSYWQNGNDKRILYTAGPNLWALDANTGKPIESFGNKGKVDLHTGLPEIAKDKFIISNTPGTIFENLIYMPLRLSEDADAAPGDIRAFDVVSGKLVWTFHTIPYPGEKGYETFPKDAYKNDGIGAVNNWSGMAVDKARGILYVPTGSAAYDFYGGNRPGENLFSNCLLALDARTGKLKWHYQFVHHDIWDRDLPAPPNLITLNKNGKAVDAVAQVTKQGYVFVFDRVTGKSLFPINEVPVPKSKLKGEITWPTQPVPSSPKPYARESFKLTEKDISPYAQNREELIKAFRTYKKGLFDPPSEQGTIIFPGYDGGAEWGGSAVDPNGVIYINANEMAWIQTMKPTQNMSGVPMGEKTYVNYCQSCHQPDREGNVKSGYPSLIEIGKKHDNAALLNLINGGKGMMPGFGFIKPEEKQALIAFLKNEEKKEVQSKDGQLSQKAGIAYKMTGYNKFLDNRGLPAIAPPWGTLNAIDLNSGKQLWRIPFGNEPLLMKEGITGTGTENYGGPVITKTGLLFIAATKDATLRAFEAKTGRLVWEHPLPAAAFATPSIYSKNGKQYIVLACGGTKLGTPKGNKYVAFALE